MAKRTTKKTASTEGVEKVEIEETTEKVEKVAPESPKKEKEVSVPDHYSGWVLVGGQKMRMGRAKAEILLKQGKAKWL